MKDFKRVAIADRSFLSHKIYEMLLKPLGFSLYPYKTLRELKENLDPKWGCKVFLINNNVLENYFDNHYQWFLKESFIQSAHKIFLFDDKTKSFCAPLKKLRKSHLLQKPFHPTALAKLLGNIFKGATPSKERGCR